MLFAVGVDPIAKGVRGSFTGQSGESGFYLAFIKVCFASRAIVMSCYACFKFGRGVNFFLFFDQLAVGMTCGDNPTIFINFFGSIFVSEEFAAYARPISRVTVFGTSRAIRSVSGQIIFMTGCGDNPAIFCDFGSSFCIGEELTAFASPVSGVTVFGAGGVLLVLKGNIFVSALGLFAAFGFVNHFDSGDSCLAVGCFRGGVANLESDRTVVHGNDITGFNNFFAPNKNACVFRHVGDLYSFNYFTIDCGNGNSALICLINSPSGSFCVIFTIVAVIFTSNSDVVIQFDCWIRYAIYPIVCTSVISDRNVNSYRSTSGLSAFGASAVFIIMVNHIDRSSFKFFTTGAISCFFTLYGAGRSLGYFPFTKDMVDHGELGCFDVTAFCTSFSNGSLCCTSCVCSTCFLIVVLASIFVAVDNLDRGNFCLTVGLIACVINNKGCGACIYLHGCVGSNVGAIVNKRSTILNIVGDFYRDDGFSFSSSNSNQAVFALVNSPLVAIDIVFACVGFTLRSNCEVFAKCEFFVLCSIGPTISSCVFTNINRNSLATLGKFRLIRLNLGSIINKVNHPTMIYLCLFAVLTNITVNSNYIAYNRLCCHIIITSVSVCRIETVNIEGSSSIGDVHIAPIGSIYFGDSTGYVIFVFAVFIRFIQSTQLVCLLDGELGICFGRHNGSATVIALIVGIFVGVRKGICHLMTAGVTNLSIVTGCLVFRGVCGLVGVIVAELALVSVIGIIYDHPLCGVVIVLAIVTEGLSAGCTFCFGLAVRAATAMSGFTICLFITAYATYIPVMSFVLLELGVIVSDCSFCSANVTIDIASVVMGVFCFAIFLTVVCYAIVPVVGRIVLPRRAFVVHMVELLLNNVFTNGAVFCGIFGCCVNVGCMGYYGVVSITSIYCTLVCVSVSSLVSPRLHIVAVVAKLAVCNATSRADCFCLAGCATAAAVYFGVGV